MKIEKQVFNEMIQKNLDEIRKINEQKEKEYQWETKYSTFEYSAKLWFLSVENLLFIRWIWDKINRLSSLHRKNFENSVSWETVFDTCNDLINYSALLADYLISKDWTTYNKIFDEVAKIFENKNWDYSNTQDDAIANFNEIENLWLWKTEDWMLARIAIKVQRIANFLRNWEKNERFYDEIIDLIIYTLIFSNYLKYKMWNTSNTETNTITSVSKQEETKQEELNTIQSEPQQETIKTDIENAFEQKIEEQKEIKKQEEEQRFKEDVEDKNDLDKIIEHEVNDINTKIIEEQIIESAPSKKTEEIIEKDKVKKERKSKKIEEKQEEIILDFDVDDIMKNVTNEVNTEVEEKIQKNNEIKQQEQVSQENEDEENPFDKQSWEEKLDFIWKFL